MVSLSSQVYTPPFSLQDSTSLPLRYHTIFKQQEALQLPVSGSAFVLSPAIKQDNRKKKKKPHKPQTICLREEVQSV